MSKIPAEMIKNPDYFTAILQLRYVSKEIIDFLKNKAKKDKSRPLLAREIKQKNGSDFYLSPNKFARRVAQELVKEFGGKLNEAERLHTQSRQSSKRIYRLNILIEFPIFKIHDVIKYKKKPVKIKHIGKKVNVWDLITDKSKIIEYKNIKEFEILKKFETRVIKVNPEIMIMDEDNQPATILNNTKKDFKPGEKVKVVFCEGYYII